MPDIARNTVVFPEGQIRLDKVYGAPDLDPAKIERFHQEQIPQILEATREHLPYITDLLRGYRISQIDGIKRFTERLSKHRNYERIRAAIWNAEIPEVDIKSFIKEGLAISYSGSGEDDEIKKSQVLLKSTGISKLASILANDKLDDIGLINETAQTVYASRNSTLALYKYRDEIQKIVGVSHRELISSILDAIPNNFADYDDPETKIGKSLEKQFEDNLRKISPAKITAVSPTKMFTKLSQDLGADVVDSKSFMQEEQQHKQLFLRSLNKMLDKIGQPETANKLFAEGAGFGAGSRPVVVLVDYNSEIAGRMAENGTNESTTKYKMLPSASIIPESRTEARKNGTAIVKVTQPVLGLDAEAIKTFNRFGVDNGKVLEWSKNYLRTAAMVDHDYLHVIINPRQDGPYSKGSNFVFPTGLDEETKATIPKPLQPSGHLEDFTLSLHAKILKRLFDDAPKRKEVVLSRAAESYVQLAEMQKTALGNAHNDSERMAVKEATTYLAEIESHRLFRAFSPDDQALKAKVQVQTPDGIKSISVADAMDKLELVSPKSLAKVTKIQSGLEKLAQHTESVFGDVYRKIHTVDSFPMINYEELRSGNLPLKVRYMDTTSILNEAVQAISGDHSVATKQQSGTTEESKLRMNGSASARSATDIIPDTIRKLPNDAANAVNEVKTTITPQLHTANSWNNVGSGVGLGMGTYGLHSKLNSHDSAYHQDLAAGGTREKMAKAGITADSANVTLGAVDIVALMKGSMPSIRTLAGNMAVPLSLVSGVTDTNAAIVAKDGHRAVESLAGTYGGIGGGIGGVMAGTPFGPAGMVIGGISGALGASELTRRIAGSLAEIGRAHV